MQYGYYYTADELFEYPVTIAIMLYMNLKKEGKLPTVAPMKMPSAPNMATLGTMSELVNNLYKQTENTGEVKT